MNETEIKDRVIQIVSNIFEERGFEKDVIEYIDLIDDAGLDSITFVSLVIEIETEFGITVPDEMLLPENFRQIDNFVSVIKHEITLSETM